MGWVEGRQGTGYQKLLIFQSKRFKFDVYLLRYREGASIPYHTDPVKGREHHRLNIFLKNARLGGHFIITDNRDMPYVPNGRFQYFRPDLTEHMVSEVLSGMRYVLSIGWLK